MKAVMQMTPGVGKQLGHFADAPDVFRAVLGRETEVGAKAVADVVAVEDVGVAAQVEQLALQFGGDGGLAGTGQAGQPDDAAGDGRCAARAAAAVTLPWLQ